MLSPCSFPLPLPFFLSTAAEEVEKRKKEEVEEEEEKKTRNAHMQKAEQCLG